MDRRKVLLKYGGKCAYCGCPVTLKNFQVDHIIPVAYPRGYDLLKINDLENLNPACRVCNNYKSSRTLEAFRKGLEDHPTMLYRDSSHFRRAMKHGIVKIKKRSVVFYFEQLTPTPATNEG